MAPLIALLCTFILAVLALRWRALRRGASRPDLRLAGRIAMAAMLVLSGSAHFVSTEAFVAMVPPLLPAPAFWVYLTGVAELAFAAALLLWPRPWLGWALAALFVALLPANIYAALAGVGYGQHTAAYLWFRVPLQALFIAWALASTGVLALGRRDALATGNQQRSHRAV